MKIIICIGYKMNVLSPSAKHFVVQKLSAFLKSHSVDEFWIVADRSVLPGEWSQPNVHLIPQTWASFPAWGVRHLLIPGRALRRVKWRQYDLALWIDCPPGRLKAQKSILFTSSRNLSNEDSVLRKGIQGNQKAPVDAILYYALGKVPEFLKGLSGYSHICHQLPIGLSIDNTDISWDTRSKTREGLSEGKEYYLYTGPIGNGYGLIELLKAFSFLKKRSISTIQLVLSGPRLESFDQFSKELITYYYRSDVRILDETSSIPEDQVMAAAYGLVFPNPASVDPVLILNAWKANIPCILPVGSPLLDSDLEGWMTFANGNISQLGDCLYTLYKDEKQRRILIQRSWQYWDACNGEGKGSLDQAMALA